jgi:hypothetical protein
MALAACQSESAPKPKPASATTIEVRTADELVASVRSGRPCRATVDGIEMQVGSPLLAQIGADRWTAEVAANGTTLRKNDQQVARIHAKQLFDPEGIPIIRVLDNGDVADKSNAIIYKAVVENGGITLGPYRVTGTTDVVIAAMLTARGALAEVRGLAACHYLFEQYAGS